ncbi:MAG: putative bifunctional phosphatase/peptidyl-prolyl cis-trans isomerase [Parcubacteria bacterium OLB19]|nr:MAG: putative bifunctional phosphatase/peptidyl-prolyl cis-trans isomerase [Parcubacteria bacterium OLB19]
MTQNNIITVVGLLVGCAVLIIGLALWIGPSKDSTTSLTNKDEVGLENEELEAPLKPEELAAYNATMTNEKNPIAKFTTNHGIFEIELFEDTMPITAGNFIKLADEGFYNGIKFHRVIDGFMIQGGDPNTKTDDVMSYGRGGPGYSIPDEHISGEHLTNIRGTISMANSGPNSGGSQFFINVADNKFLDFDVPDPNNSAHPVFGQVVSGMNIVDEISLAETNPSDMPIEPIIIEKVEIVKN